MFRPEKHAARLQHSASFVAMPAPPIDHFMKSVNLAVAINADFVPPTDKDALLYIRPVLFASGPQIVLAPPAEFTFCVYVQPGISYHGISPVDAVILEDFDRAAPRGTGSAKVGGNYAPTIPWMGKARAQGYPITLHLDSKTNTEIEEFSTSAFLGVKRDGNDYTLTAPDSKNVVQSVTSGACMEIAKQLGWKTEQRSVSGICLSVALSVLKSILGQI
jgi:branched-chain amino acid aminotransferase